MNTNKHLWITIAIEELKQIWMSLKGVGFLLGFSLFLSIFITTTALNPEMNVISHLKWIYLTINTILLIGTAATAILSANSISSQRDNETLESLLLTPVKRSHIIFGKLTPILSLWIGMVIVSIPYLFLLLQSTRILSQTITIFVLSETILIVITSLICIFISSISSKNITSLISSISLIAILFSPTYLSGNVKELPIISQLILINPYTAIAKFQQLVIMEGELITKNISLFISPVIIMLTLLIIIPILVNKHFSLFGWVKSKPKNKSTILLLFFISLFLLSAPGIQAINAQSEIYVDLNTNKMSLVAGNKGSIIADITNEGLTTTPPLMISASIIRVGEKGIFADPEEVFSEITFYVDTIMPGETIEKNWEINGVFEGEFIVFITTAAKDATFVPSVSEIVEVSILQNNILPMNRVIPVVTIVPIILLLILIVIGLRSKKK